MRKRLVALLLTVAPVALLATAGRGAETGPEALLEAGHWKRLRAYAEPRVAANPNDTQAVYYLASAKAQLGDLQGAMPLAEKTLASDANNAHYHLLVANICLALTEHAGMFKAMSLANRFKEEAQKAVALDPNLVDAREALMEYYHEAPGIAGGDKKKAWATAEEIAGVDSVRGWLAKGELASLEKNAAKGEEFYKQALAAAPNDARVLRAAASFYASDVEKKYDVAEKYALAALKLDELRAGAFVALAMAYAGEERWPELDALMTRAEKSVPDDFGAYYQSGKTLLFSGKDLPRAERYFRKYLTMEPEGGEPNHAAAHWRLGLVLEKEGKRPEAIGEMDEALREQPDLKEAKDDLKRVRNEH